MKASRATKALRIEFENKLTGSRGFYLFCSCMTVGICGWILETIVYFIEFGRLYDCGLLILPFCPIYANGILLIWMPFKRGVLNVRNFIKTAAIAAVLSTALEAFTGVLFGLFNITLWDYSSWPLSTKYVSLPASICWGISGALYIYYVMPLISIIAARIPRNIRGRLILTTCTVLVLDFIYSISLIAARGYYKPLY